MKNKHLLIFAGLMSILFGCNNHEKNYVVKVKLHQLAEADIFKEDKVYDVIFDAEELDVDSLKNKSRQLFLSGIDMYKNKKEPANAIEFFKQSILVFPEAKTYYEYGNALIDTKNEKNYDLAINAFNVAEHLDFQPKSLIHYNKACAYYMMSKSHNPADGENYDMNTALYQLRLAFENGFSDTTMLAGDTRIKTILAADNYKIMLSQVNNGSGKNKPSMFDSYISSFPVKAETFEIPKEKVQLADYKVSINYAFAEYVPEMENSSFGRDVSHDFYFVARVGETDKYKAVLYSSINFYGQDMQPVTTNLVTYTPSGKIIASRIFSCQCSAEKVKAGKIDKGQVTIDDYKVEWKEAIDKVSFDKNSISKYELVSSTKFKIDDSGNISEETAVKYGKAPTEKIALNTVK